MQNARKIPLPVDFPNALLNVIHQSATLARHFKSEIMMMHTVTALSHAAGMPLPGRKPADWDLLAVILEEAQKQHHPSLASELDGLIIQRLLGEGDPASAIVHAAEKENADLIMMRAASLR